MFKYSDKEIARLIDAIFAGTVTQYDLPKSLYFAIAEHLKSGLYEGYGFSISSLKKKLTTRVLTEGMNMQDLELLAELRTNIYMFSAAKTYTQVKTMTQALISESGTIMPFKEFKAAAMQTFDLFNKTWLTTEYNTAIGQAQNAVKWREIEKQADVLPMLKYDAVLDKHTSEICRPLDGLMAPVNDPIWKKVMPLNHFNCRCLVKQLPGGKATSDAKKEKAFKNATDQMQDVFKMNAGQDGYIFKKDHPYFNVPNKDKEYAKNNFNLPIPKNDK